MTDWIQQHWLQVAITLAVVAVYVALDRLAAPRIERVTDQGRFDEDAATRAIRTARLIAGVAGLLTLAIVWGIEIGSVVVFAGTALTLLGVALFATWSLLSNVTAYFVLMLHPAFRRGTFIRVFEADNYTEGYIAEINLFSTRLITEDRETLIYPNNLLVGRPALINPRDRLKGIGKLPPGPAPTPRSWKRGGKP